ncbi:RsiV family protein [Bacillus testis]|uniref:RsiV family protein n=1 Tax=Bacillus testis TaxID=1622072 RepID=UPI00067E82EC|nr:RsiV family protein [Bacillus testis]
MDPKLDRLKEEYMNISIPKELDQVVAQALHVGITINGAQKKKKKRKTWMAYVCSAIAAAALLLVSVVNISPAAAKSLAEVPLIGKLVEVLAFREYSYNDGQFSADIKVPSIHHMENKGLEHGLNEKYLAENKQLFKDFKEEMEAMKKQGGGHLGVDAGYKVVTDNGQLLSIGRYKVVSQGSASTQIEYDTIDLKRQIFITLPSLFKNEGYVEAISRNIITQMKHQMEKDEDVHYWLDPENDLPYTGVFTKIKKDQNFYVNAQNQLVISFDEYEVAPGYMGVCEFTIPTEVIKRFLVSNEYIK